MPKYSCLQVCCQSINLKMAIRAETCSWYLCNKQYISNYQIVVFDSWLIQYTERFLIPCPRHVSSRLPPSGETCKYATTPSTQKTLGRFSIYWLTPFCCVCFGCCAAEFGTSGGTYELPCTIKYSQDQYTSFSTVLLLFTLRHYVGFYT